jgi:hypothetical protein
LLFRAGIGCDGRIPGTASDRFCSSFKNTGAFPMMTSRAFRLAVAGVVSAALIAVLAAISSTVGAQEQQAPPQLPQATEHHRILQQDVGTWDATMKIWPAADAAPLESKGTEKNELLPGGMWLVGRFEGEVLGMPFTGASTLGYDPVEKKYIGTWIDSMTPYLTTLKGDYDVATKTLTAIAEGRDFEKGGAITKSKQISRDIDENTRSFEIHMNEDGKERKVMEIMYKRRAQ